MAAAQLRIQSPSKKKARKMIRIVQFLGSMDMGGAETLLVNVYRNIDRHKYHFIFMENVPERTYYTSLLEQMDGEIVKTPKFTLRGILFYYVFLVKYFKNNNIDIVHSHTYLHSWIVLAAAKRAGVKKRIAHAHAAMRSYDNGSEFKRSVLRRLLRYYATDFIACSTDSRDDLFKGHEDQSVIIKNPVDLSRFDNISKGSIELLRNKYRSGLIIGYIGRMVKQKNPIFLCRIALQLRDMGVDYKLLWLGDGVMRPDIENFIKENNLEDNIVLLGVVDDVAPYIEIFDIFLMPSLFEGLSLAAVEVQSQGVPCIFSTTTSRDTKINDNVVFLPIDNATIWADKILVNSKRLAASKARRNIISKGFDIKSVTHRFEECYKK